MRLLIYGAIVAAMLGLGWAAVATYKHAIERAAQLERDLGTMRQAHDDSERENKRLREEKARLDALLAKREGTRQGAADERRRLDAKLDEVFANNQAARDWGAQPVPAALLDSLRLKPAGRLDDANRPGKPSAQPARPNG